MLFPKKDKFSHLKASDDLFEIMYMKWKTFLAYSQKSIKINIKKIRKTTCSNPLCTIGKTIGVIGARTMRLAVPHFNRLMGASSWDTFPSGNV